MIVIGDVHGCHKTLMALTNKLPSNRDLCFVGDLVDRGKDSAKVIDFVFNNRFRCVRGNHEDFIIHAYDDDGFDTAAMQMWRFNGGGETIRSLGDRMMGFRETCKRLPITIEYTNEAGVEYIISHSYCGLYWKTRHDDFHKFAQETMWSRDFTGDLEGKINTIGHTPVEHVVEFDDYIMLDTGCVFDGALSALDLETGKIYQQQNIEED